MEEAMKNTRTETFTLASLIPARLTVRVHTPGTSSWSSTMVSGCVGFVKATVFGKTKKATATLGSGEVAELWELALSLGLMAISMKDSGR